MAFHRHFWEQPDYEADAPGEELDAAAAGQEFADNLIYLKQTGRISARSACILAHYASKAGATGLAGDLGLPPGRQSGAYSQHFDRVLGIDLKRSSDWYCLRLPMFNKYDGCREVREVEVLNLHEVLVDECACIPDLAERIEACQESLPPSYAEHIVNLRGPGRAVPLSLYMDGVQYAKRKSLLAVYLWNMLTGVRHLVCILQKQSLCKCGCSGFCSLFEIWSWVRWCCDSLADGRYPTARHDGREWSEADGHRRVLSGQMLGVRGCIVALKADWAEVCHTMGMPPWNVVPPRHPCPICTAARDTWCNLDGYSVLDMPSSLKTCADYDEACSRCEQRRVVDRNAWALIQRTLQWDKKKWRGRALKSDLPTLNLMRGDRLEPGGSLRDVADGFDGLACFPAELLFWRLDAETATKHRVPIFVPHLGLHPHQCIAVDYLHCLSLGVFQVFASGLLHSLIALDVWQTGETTLEAKTTMSVMRMRSELHKFYSDLKRQGATPTEITDLTPTMIGTPDDPGMKIKGSETNYFLGFLWRLLHRRGDALHDLAVWREVCGALLKILELIRDHPVKFPPNAIQATI